MLPVTGRIRLDIPMRDVSGKDQDDRYLYGSIHLETYRILMIESHIEITSIQDLPTSSDRLLSHVTISIPK